MITERHLFNAVKISLDTWADIVIDRIPKRIISKQTI